ncbi:MAG: tol-pal system YbgF family protein [Planctomycetota bacterium]
MVFSAVLAASLVGCSTAPLAVPSDPAQALEVAAGAIDTQPEAAAAALAKLDEAAFSPSDRERLGFERIRARASAGDLYGAWRALGRFVREHPLGMFQPRVQTLHFAIARALLERDASYFIFGSDHDDAIVVLRDFVERYPTDPEAAHALFLLGEDAFAAERFGEARRRFEEVIASHPDSEWVAAAHQRRVMAQFAELEGPEYDLPAMQQAKNELADFLRIRPPERPDFRQEAETALATVEDWIRTRYQQNANFYRTLGNELGEAYWLRRLVAEFPDDPGLAAATERLTALDAVTSR